MTLVCYNPIEDRIETWEDGYVEIVTNKPIWLVTVQLDPELGPCVTNPPQEAGRIVLGEL